MSGAKSATERPALPGRFRTLDGLRGIAAMLVVGYHLHANLRDEAASWLTPVIRVLLEHGYLGVQIFFVLSGYAIASSFGDRRVDGRYVGVFALRRSIRLDPPYWLSIATAIALAVLSSALFPDLHREIPSWQQVLAHVLYLQILLGYGDIVPIYWTLCLEIQFYLLLALLLWSLQTLGGEHRTDRLLQATAVRALLLVSAWVSALAYGNVLPELWPGLFLPFWFYFVMGAVVFWCARGWLPNGCFWLLAAGVAVCILPLRPVNGGMGLFTAILLHGILRVGAGDRLLGSAPFQFLGGISYSLYLFHPIVGWSAISLGKRLLGPQVGAVETIVLFFGGVAVSVVTAWVVCRLVERPAQRFARRLDPAR